MWEKRESLTANDNDLISASLKKSFAPLPLEGADERSEAGLAFPNVGVPLHADNLRLFGAPPSKGRREKKGCVYRHRYICGKAATRTLNLEP